MQKMNIVAYQKAAQRTLAQLGNRQSDNIHMALGMLTEAGEISDIFKRELAYKKPVDMINLQEEIGDVLYYVVGLASMHNIGLKAPDIVDLEGMKLKVAKYKASDPIFHIKLVADGMEFANKFLQKAIDDRMPKEDGVLLENLADTISLNQMIEHAMKFLTAISLFHDLDIEEIMYKNIEKLKLRFPEKFTESDALNRDTAAEREVLESEENPY